MNKTVGVVASVLVALFIIVCGVLFYNGSLEMFPTAEQIEKGRIVWGLCLVLLSALEAFIIIKTVKAFKNR